MMIQPDAVAELTYLPTADDYPEQPPILWHTVAPAHNAESGTSVTGRYDPATGDIKSVMVPKFTHNLLAGTEGDGYAWNIQTGAAWTDDWTSPHSGKRAVMHEAGDNSAFEIWRDPDGGRIKPRLYVIHRGITPLDATRTPAGTNAYLELAHGDPIGNYRLCFESGAPIRLQYRSGLYGGWKDVSQCSDLPNCDDYLQQNNGQIRVETDPDYYRGMLTVRVAGGRPMRHAVRPARPNPTDPNAPGLLPSTEQVRFYGQSGWAGFEMHPFRCQPITVEKSPLPLGEPHQNAGNAAFIPNTLSTADPFQETAFTAAQDGDDRFGWTATVSLPDAGDGLGSEEPARFTDVLCYIPAVWSRYAGIGLPVAALRTIAVTERSVWDDAQRIGYTTGEISFQNYDHRYADLWGHYAINLEAGDGVRWGQRCRGVAGLGDPGIGFVRHDPVNVGSLPFSDFTAKLQVPLGYEINFDGFSAHTAVRLLLEAGSISPKYLGFIPDDGFPPYPDGFTGPILPKGTGINPRMRFLPQQTVLECILEIVQNTGMVSNIYGNITSTPYYFFFDVYGNAHFEPYNPAYWPLKKHYSSFEASGLDRLQHLQIYNSVSQMRTDVTLQGQDAYTYELLNLHIPLPMNTFRVGFRYPVLERNSRYGSDAYMQQAGRTLAVQSSLGTQILRFTAPFDPTLAAGDVIAVSDTRWGTGLYNVLEIVSRYGLADDSGTSPLCVSESQITARSLLNSVVL